MFNNLKIPNLVYLEEVFIFILGLCGVFTNFKFINFKYRGLFSNAPSFKNLEVVTF